VLVAPAYHDNVFALEPEIPCKDVGGEELGEGSKVGTVVDVRPTAADNPSSQFFARSENGIRVLASWL